MPESKVEEQTESQQAAAAREQADVAKELAKNPRDETVPGGRYIVGDVAVNADGDPVKD